MKEKNLKSAKKVEFNGNIEALTEYLVKCRNRGESIYVEYEGHRFYSDDATIDNIYLKLYGMTKAKFDELIQDYEEAEVKGDKETQKRIKEEWIRKQKLIIKTSYDKELDAYEQAVLNGEIEIQEILKKIITEKIIAARKALNEEERVEKFDKIEIDKFAEAYEKAVEDNDEEMQQIIEQMWKERHGGDER